MRAVSACLLFAIAAAVVSAQTCTAPSSDPLNPSTGSGCNLIQSCQSNLCACVGSSTGSYPSCLSTNTGLCTNTQSCYATYFVCLTAVSQQRQNSSNSACASWGNSLYMVQLAAAASATFNSTALYSSCAYDLCLLKNQTGNTAGCSSTDAVAAVCTSANLLGSATTTPAPTTAVVYDIVATFRLSGSNWSLILNNATALAQLQAGIQSDLATFLNVLQKYIQIFSLTQGSLIVNFGVSQGSGKSPSQLATTVTAAQGSTSWLTSTAAIYSTVGTDSVAVTSVGVNQTAAPTAAPPGSSAMSAAGVWAVAAVAAVLALMA